MQFPLPNILRLCHQVSFAQHGGLPCWAASSPDGEFRDGEIQNDVMEQLLPLLNPTLLTLQLAGYEVNKIAFRIQSPTQDLNHYLEVSLSGFQFTNYPLDGTTFPRPWNTVTGIQWSGSGFAVGRIPATTSIAVAFAITPRPAQRDGRETFAIPLNIPMGNVTFGSAINIVTTSFQQWLCLAVDEAITWKYTEPPPLWSVLRDLETPLADLEAEISSLLVARWRKNDGLPEGLLHIFSPYRYNTQPFEFAMPDNWGWGSPDCWLGGKSWRAYSSVIDLIFEVWKPYVHPDQPSEQECVGFLGTFTDALFPAEAVIKTSQELAHLARPQGSILNLLPYFTLQDLVRDVREIILNAQEFDDQFEYSESDRLITAIDTGLIPNSTFFTSAKTRLENDRQMQETRIENAVNHRLENLDKLTWAEVLMCLHNLQVIDILGLGGPNFLQSLEQPEDYTGYYDADDLSDGYTVQLNQAGDYITGYLQFRIPKSIRDDYGLNFGIGNPRIELYETNLFSEYQLYWITFSFTDPTLCKIAPLYPINPPESSTPLVPNNNLAVSITTWEIVNQSANGDFVIRLQLSDPLVLLNFGAVETPDELVLKRIETRPFISDDAYLHLPQEIGAELRSEYRYPLTAWEWDSVLEILPILSQYLLERSGNNQLYRTLYPQICDTLGWFVIFDQNGAVFRQGEQWVNVKGLIRALAQLTSFNSYLGFRNIYVAVSEFLGQLTTWTILETLIMTILGLEESDLIDYSTLKPTVGSYKYEWQMISGGTSIEAGIGLGAGIGLVHIRTIGYPNTADPDAIFDAWYYVRYAKFAPPPPIGGSVGFEEAITISEWSGLEAAESWSSSDFAGTAVNFTFYAISGALIIGYATDEDYIIFFEPGHQPLVADTENAYVIGLALSVEFVTFTLLRLVKLLDQPPVDPLMLPWQSSTTFSTENSSKDIVYFSPPGSSTLSPQAEQILRQMVAEFRSGFESPHSHLSIVGYASRSGQPDDNQDLSERRARTTYDFIYSLLGKAFRIPTNNIAVRGYGERMAEFAGQADRIEDPDWRKVEVRLNGVLISRLYGEQIDD